jgi:hypothetical protein
MMAEFHSATFACSYLSAEPRTVSQAWSSHQWDHNGGVKTAVAYGECDLLKLFGGEW